mmetsp:Transcript_71571/g.203054  ORF Transcript_71571/g.203054 Transcript_71571/m.203054 type:complete len:282 (-) Transcript_71571:77-922(-)
MPAGWPQRRLTRRPCVSLQRARKNLLQCLQHFVPRQSMARSWRGTSTIRRRTMLRAVSQTPVRHPQANATRAWMTMVKRQWTPWTAAEKSPSCCQEVGGSNWSGGSCVGFVSILTPVDDDSATCGTCVQLWQSAKEMRRRDRWWATRAITAVQDVHQLWQAKRVPTRHRWCPAPVSRWQVRAFMGNGSQLEAEASSFLPPVVRRWRPLQLRPAGPSPAPGGRARAAHAFAISRPAAGRATREVAAAASARPLSARPASTRVCCPVPSGTRLRAQATLHSPC